MSEMMINQTIENTENIDQKALELAQDFSYDGYQVVRRELFAHLREPAVVIRRDSVTFNTACIAGLEDAVYIQILVNQDNKRMVVRKCEENDKDALRWCIEKPDKRKSRKMSNKLFSAMMYDMMGWNTDCRYKILGHKITHEDETMYIFDLLETEIFMDTKRKKKANPDSLEKKEELVTAETDQTPEQNQEEIEAKVARKLNRIPFYPKDWKDSFGLSVEEHKKALETNLTDGYIEFFSNKVIGESALIWKGGVQMPKTTVNITGVSLCQKKGIIRIFRSTIKELGDPRYIRFLFNPEKRTLAVQSVSRKEAECFRVPKYNPKDWDFKICSIQMLRIIWRVCEWNENDTYRIAGTHYPEYNLVEFNLNQARIVQFGEIE